MQLGQPEKTYDHILCLTAQQMGSFVACKVQPCLNACYGCSNHLPKGNSSFEAVIAHYQQLVRKGDTHPAYKVLRQLSKPKCQPAKQLRHGISGRQLHTAPERIAE